MLGMKDNVRRYLEDMNVGEMHKLWPKIFPRETVPRDYAQTRVAMHIARTHTETVHLKHRLYSHFWLTERNLPSKLPEELRPPNEEGPRIVAGTGIAVLCGKNRGGEQRAYHVRSAMERAVLDAAEAGIEDKTEIARMMWAYAERARRD